MLRTVSDRKKVNPAEPWNDHDPDDDGDGDGDGDGEDNYCYVPSLPQLMENTLSR